MIEERAVVTAVDGELISLGGYQKSACGGCVQKSSCGTTVLGRFMGSKEVEVKVKSDLSLMPGDQVLIGVGESAMLWGALRVYTMPLLVFFLFALIGEQFAESVGIEKSELVSLVFAVLGFAGSFFLLKKSHWGSSSEQALNPVIIRKL